MADRKCFHGNYGMECRDERGSEAIVCRQTFVLCLRDDPGCVQEGCFHQPLVVSHQGKS